MSDVVELRPADIRGQLQRIMRRRAGHSPRPVALYGTGPKCTFDVEGVPWSAVPVRSELAFRVQLTQLEHDSAVVFLVDYDDRLPLDIACRLAGQRVYPVDRQSRLATLFGARKVAPGFSHTTLAEVLLDERPTLPAIKGTLLQPNDAWRRYLHVHLKLPFNANPTVAELMAVAFERAEDGPTFGVRLQPLTRQRLRDEAADWLERAVGPAARTVWIAWTTGRAKHLVTWLVYIDAALRADDEQATLMLAQGMRFSPNANDAWINPEVSEPLCIALDALLHAVPKQTLNEILAAASTLPFKQEFDRARRASPWLPEGFNALQAELAEAINKALTDTKALPTALKRFAELEEHHLAHRHSGASDMRAAGLRLLTWFAWDARRPVGMQHAWQPMAELAQWYDTQGGWLDWARDDLRAKSTSSDALNEALRAVLHAADEKRRAMDARFANATLAWHTAGKPATDVLPIERITQDVAAQFLTAGQRRKLLIILLDGMSVAVATRLTEAHDGWAPVVWTPPKHRAIPPGIAALPSLTKTSRAAFFAGQPSAKFGDEPESRDVKRFAANKALAPFAGPQGPQLFLKASIGSPNNIALPLMAALQDDGERVVGVVVNAIDDHLKGSDQVSPAYEQPGAIPVLIRLLQLAGESERAVLLVSDHGHIPRQVLKGNKPPEGTTHNGHRWRALQPGQVAQDGEIQIPSGCWAPKGSQGVAVFHDERRAWGNACAGAHGGLTLAESVIAVRLIAPDWLAGVMQPADDELHTQEAMPPRWWRLEVPPPPIKHLRPVVQPELPIKIQPSLFDPPVVEAPPPVDDTPPEALSAARHALTEALAKSELFIAKTKAITPADTELALLFVDVLACSKSDHLSRSAFALATGLKTRKLSGKISNLGFLNTDGYAVIEDDTSANQVRLHRARLIAQYGLEP